MSIAPTRSPICSRVISIYGEEKKSHSCSFINMECLMDSCDEYESDILFSNAHWLSLSFEKRAFFNRIYVSCAHYNCDCD